MLCNGYEHNTLPGALSDFGQAVQTAFGTRVVPVTPTEKRFSIFNGVYVVYVNTQANVGYWGFSLLKRHNPL